ncbi:MULTISPECIES: GntR family transcriptional regulator [Coprobacillaceae]|uniref:GntR family transcriptional regulator n=1 Tax=Coprobacillaceae TaxID=2810280 RepID=UPI000E53D6FC|nr:MULTISPECIES: GntR family transcriptional regulator [Coprobacillaceae]RHM59965.1 GntR family transcriptional regulator [Coprobacillus sp. AF33-1AC]RHS92302.1 GntR family transcriptional regulator [Erysipelatoclostridium sp. AM42-17]
MKRDLLENAGHGSLGHKIFCILRDKILNEDYEAGQKLNEVALSKELNISRTPIREALKQLELEGLVKSIPNKGVYVLGFSPRDIDDMLEIRLVLEGLSIQLAIDRISEAELEKIKEIYDLLEFYAKKNDQEKFTEINIEFHEAIYRGTHSQYFEQLLSDINYYIHVTSRHSIRQPDRLLPAAQEHKEILEAIEKRDKELAKEKIQKHIRKTQLLVKNYYAQKEKIQAEKV